MWRLPAEWEEQECIELAWPSAESDWGAYLDEIVGTMVELVSAITRFEDVVIVSREPDETWEALSGLSEEQKSRVSIQQNLLNDTWARDHGGISLIGEGKRKILDFCFNGWGEKFASFWDNQVTGYLVEGGYIEGELEDNNDFVLEGGSIECDGAGTLYVTSACLLAKNRNEELYAESGSALSYKDWLTEELKRRLYVERVVWLDLEPLEGDDTDGHIDTLFRLCPGGAAVANAECGMRNAELKITMLPMPEPIYYEGEKLPATYANFLVINGAVIVPTYGQEANDKQAMQIIAEAYPGREVIGIDSRVIIRQHGSIHCLTMHYPRA